MADVLTLSQKEYERMVRSASNEVIKSDRQRKQQKLRELSKQREATWTNTLAGQRRMKYEQKRLREEALERERQKIDAEEEKIRSKVRKEMIEKAKRQMFEQRDRIKTLRSKQLLSDVLLEQENQVRERKKRIVYEKRRDAYFHKLTMEAIERGERKERDEKEERKQRAKNFARLQIAQLQDATERKIKSLVQAKIEGEIIAENARRAVAEENAKKEARRREARQNNMEMKNANERLEKMREKMKEKYAIEEQKIKDYARKRDETEKMRKAYKAKCHAEKQREVQKMIDRAVEHLQNMSNTEAARLDRDVKAKKESDDRKAREKAEWRQRNWEACDKSRKGQMANRARKAREQRKRDVELRNKWAAQCLAMKEQTRQEKADIRSKNEKNAAFLNDQIREKQLKRERSRANKLRFEKEALRKDKQDEEEFVAYLRKQVDEAAALGKNVESMKRVLRPRGLGNI